MARRSRSRSRSRRGRGRSPSPAPAPAPAVPFAIALFYKPSLAAAIAAGIKLPQPGVDASIYPAAVRAGVVLPASHIHLDPNAPPPDAPPSTYPLLHSDIPLPATLYASTADIHPKTFDLAKCFVRMQTFDAQTMYFPDPAPGESTPAILCNTGDIKDWESPIVLRTFNVRRTSELRSVLKKDGPMLVRVLELEELRQAPEIQKLLNAKMDQGWKFWPTTKTITSLVSIANSATKLHDKLLPDLRAKPEDKAIGRLVKRQIRLIKDASKSVQSRVRKHVITALICGKMSRAVSKVHAPQPKKPPAYLVKKIDKFAPKLLAHLQRPVVFRPNFN